MTAAPATSSSTAELDAILAGRDVRTVFQPIVDLASGAVVAHEALSRGPAGPLQHPGDLFEAARRAGRLAELDRVCALSALGTANEVGLHAPVALFVNVEPEVLDRAGLDELSAMADTGTGGLRVVLEITERALATRPAELLRAVERVRDLGWGIALDDVGVESASLAFMSLLRPDVVKLDLAIVQGRPDRTTAEVMHAVNAYAERTGARILGEGIETQGHLDNARALGATLGQGWLFGRPTDQPDQSPAPDDGHVLSLAPLHDDQRSVDSLSPFQALPQDTVLTTSPKRLLVELSKQLELEAVRLGASCVVAATFQEARHFTPSTAERYRTLADTTGFVCALGRDLPDEPLPGVRGATLTDDDPTLGEWDLVVISPHFSTALLARDLGDDGPEMERRFEYALTYRRDVVADAARALLSRVLPQRRTA